jgi:hypothetical protein
VAHAHTNERGTSERFVALRSTKYNLCYDIKYFVREKNEKHAIQSETYVHTYKIRTHTHDM